MNRNLKGSAEFKEPLREALRQKSSVNICADNHEDLMKPDLLTGEVDDG